ncbi:MAG: diphthine--ammonia ligase [Acidilobaceae archaeon]
MRLCALVSGGKDSVYTLHRAIWEGHSLECLIVFHSMRDDSWLFHTPATRLVALQAEAMGVREELEEFTISGSRHSELLELEDAMRRVARRRKAEGLAVGVISSRYQRDRMSLIASRLGLVLYTPLWSVSQEEHMRSLVREGFKIVITRISTMGLHPKFLGVVLKPEHIEEIIALSKRFGFNPAFEGGEAETLVVEAPLFKKKLCLEGRVTRESLDSYSLHVERAWLEPRGGDDCIFVRRSLG